jgi:S1-C subfamily serine protease
MRTNICTDLKATEGDAVTNGRLILAIFCLLAFAGKANSQLEYVGQPVPPGAKPHDAPIERPDLDTLSLDGPSGKTILDALGRGFADQGALTTRGAKDIELYRAASPSVVVVITNAGFGSGIYLGSGRVLTNWHVVTSNKSVGIAFKPPRDGDAIDASGIVKGNVLRIDALRDLALVEVPSPPQNLRAMELGSETEIQIGADVYAIGHPTGQTWTYTRGLISQFRRAYAWQAGETEPAHRADVILTQTPINPGNSGGPLLAESGKVLGVNTFKVDGENLNFAVAVEEVRKFLDSTEAPGSAQASLGRDPACKPVELYAGRNKNNDGFLVQFATRCDKFADFSIYTPDNVKRPIQALVDTNHDEKVDIIVEDRERAGKWAISFHDVDYDGVIDLVGYHPDGKLNASRFEKYQPARKY